MYKYIDIHFIRMYNIMYVCILFKNEKKIILISKK